MYKPPFRKESFPGTVPTKKYSKKRAFHKGCFGNRKPVIPPPYVALKEPV